MLQDRSNQNDLPLLVVLDEGNPNLVKAEAAMTENV